MQKVLVTGGSGYIGSHTVVELVDTGYQPIILDDFRNSKSFILDRLEQITGQKLLHFNVDCADKGAIREIFKTHPDIKSVIHFAADKAVGESVKNPLKYYKNNLNSLTTVLEVMHEFKVPHLVFSSSCTVYGEPKLPIVDESIPILQAESPYGDTKIIGEKMIQFTAKAQQSFNATLLRYFNPIGAHESSLIGELPQGIPNNLVPYLTQTVKGIREQLTVYGNDYPTADGTCVRDYIHVVDLAKAHVKALQWLTKQKVGIVEPFNIGTGKGTSVKEIIDTFESVNGVKVNHVFGPKRAGDVVQIYANPSKASKELGWTANYTLADMLSHAWKWEQNIEGDV
ncbi:MAG: UDP-glucose 4-epimerase GalE [Crocinitomicaceae bacterium]